MERPQFSASRRSPKRRSADTSVIRGASVNGASSRPLYPRSATKRQTRPWSQSPNVSLQIAYFIAVLPLVLVLDPNALRLASVEAQHLQLDLAAGLRHRRVIILGRPHPLAVDLLNDLVLLKSRLVRRAVRKDLADGDAVEDRLPAERTHRP